MRKYFILSLLVLVLLIASCDDTSPPVQKTKQDTTTQSSQKITATTEPAFTCKDIFPEASLKSITGYDSSAFEFNEYRQTDNLRCGWVGKSDEQGIAGVTSRTYSIQVYWRKLDYFFPVSKMKNVYPNLIEVGGVGSEAWILSDQQGNPNPSSGLYTKSSNQKYAIYVADVNFEIGNPRFQERFDILKKMTKAVDANLNKYS